LKHAICPSHNWDAGLGNTVTKTVSIYYSPLYGDSLLVALVVALMAVYGQHLFLVLVKLFWQGQLG